MAVPMAGIEPVRLHANSKIKFRCHKEISCFTSCCSGINIALTPYDIIRLKNRLHLPSDEFLAIYTEGQLLEKTDLPVVTLKLIDDGPTGVPKACPFVRKDGCLIYEDRPTTCRYYPLGVAALSHKEDVDGGEFYFFVNEPHCRGFDEEKVWTVAEWRKDQGVDIHDAMNAMWTDLIVRKRSFPPNIRLTEKSKGLFFLVSYNIDGFRKFVFESSFLTRFPTDAETVEKIREDELALMNFGLKWLQSVLFRQVKPLEQAANP